jgi:hypothetical protein
MREQRKPAKMLAMLRLCHRAKKDVISPFILIPAFGPNSDSLPSPFGQGAGVP